MSLTGTIETMGTIGKYDDSWDWPHVSGASRAWQESDFLTFYDVDARVGATFRLGVHPNRDVGHATLHAFALDGMRYAIDGSRGPVARRAFTSGMRTANVTRLGGHRVEALGAGRMRFAWDEPDCAGEVEWYESFFEPRNWSRGERATSLMAGVNADGHLEALGRVRGSVRIGTGEYGIDALAYRDRSWGVRDGKIVNGFPLCQVSGTVGRRLSFTSVFMQLEGLPPSAVGFVVRDGVESDVVLLRGRVTYDYDGLTPLAVSALFTLEDGEVLTVRGRALQGHGGHLASSLCEVVHGEDTGFCMLLTGTPGHSDYLPTPEDLTYLHVKGGLSPAVAYDHGGGASL